MKKISLAPAFKYREISDDIPTSEPKLIFHDDFSNLDQWDIVNGNTVENIDGSNVLAVRNTGGLYTLVGNPLTWADCILRFRVSVMLKDETSQLDILFNDRYFRQSGLSVYGNQVKTGKWYSVDFGFLTVENLAYSEDELPDDIPFEISIMGDNDGNDDVVAYVKNLVIDILPATDVTTFGDDKWEKLYTKNNALDFETDGSILTIKPGSQGWSRSDTTTYGATPILTRKVSLPAEQSQMPMNDGDPAYSYHTASMQITAAIGEEEDGGQGTGFVALWAAHREAKPEYGSLIAQEGVATNLFYTVVLDERISSDKDDYVQLKIVGYYIGPGNKANAPLRLKKISYLTYNNRVSLE